MLSDINNIVGMLHAGRSTDAFVLLGMIALDPNQSPPPFEKLVGDLAGAYSRRINIQHRLMYEVFTAEKTVRVLRLWSHYD
jgi:Txe/YoeB family toxin of toxin-antitoxin system